MSAGLENPEVDLKPCPRCENEYGREILTNGRLVAVCCGECGFSCSRPSEADAITAWNTRTARTAGDMVEVIARIIREHHTTVVGQPRSFIGRRMTFHNGDKAAAEATLVALLEAGHGHR